MKPRIQPFLKNKRDADKHGTTPFNSPFLKGDRGLLLNPRKSVSNIHLYTVRNGRDRSLQLLRVISL